MPLETIVQEDALIGHVETPVIATIGYLALWPEHSALFFNEVGDSSTGQQHIVQFAKLEVIGHPSTTSPRLLIQFAVLD